MTNKAIADAFADGKTSGNSNSMFIERETIYSCGYHFPIATRTGHNTVDVNTAKYSRTTSKQQSAVRHALSVYGFEITEKALSK